MKKIALIALLLATFSAAAYADALSVETVLPAKSELAVSGSFVQPKGDARSVWEFNGQVAVPISKAGGVVLGPQIRLSSDKSRQAAGLVLEVNFFGSNKTGPYVGVNGLYDLQDNGDQRYTGDAVAGMKLQVGTGGFVKLFASKTVAGRGKDDSDITGNLGIGIRF